ncbi:hypothetical protein HD597_000444 [Nonomuraea thailandensis]|uniref:Uncharacterized protein n=1 Tax=Nonomuraea thailandensis TaxID=1188745 RepID=A0A9X2JYS0_9ACTN|nr:hypothetical protein [Nonomuraea thailandensis]MCP2353424.1 hypothetical protein [Nonomuraea thailandensis]
MIGIVLIRLIKEARLDGEWAYTIRTRQPVDGRGGEVSEPFSGLLPAALTAAICDRKAVDYCELEADDVTVELLGYVTDWSRLPSPLTSEQKKWLRYFAPAIADELRDEPAPTDWLRQRWTCRAGTVGDP